MTDPTPLLVPAAVQALLVNEHVQSDSSRPWARWLTDYGQLNHYADPLPPAFLESQEAPPVGVHLHWKLPSAFTHGQSAQGASAVTFPYIPNRWMVARLATAPGGGAPQLTAWVIESDFLDPEQGSSNFADPHQSQPGNVVITKVGRNQPAEQFGGEPGGPLFLRATGLADVTFTAYQPGLLDVLSFHDPVQGVADNSELTYWLCGWYSDPAHDILAASTAEALGWTILGAAGAAPNLSVVHGMIHGLTWQTDTIPPLIDPNADSMKISVGYTAVDALSAILDDGQSGGDIEMNLQAFQYGALESLDDPDGLAQVEQRIRRAWFGTTPGGTLWKIVPVAQGQADTDTGALSADLITPPFALDGGQASWLAELNLLQRQYDSDTRELQTMQWELFALWWKKQRGPFIDVLSQRGYYLDPSAILGMITDSLDPANPDGMFVAVTTLQASVASLKAQLPDPTDSASIALFSAQIPDNQPTAAGEPRPLTLRPSSLKAFHHPADPVVMVAGMTPPSNDVDETNGLPCRTVDAAVTGVKANSTSVTRASGSLTSAIALPPAAALPAPVATAVNAIAVESFFADPGNAALILQDGLGISDQGSIDALTTAMAAGTAQISSIPNPLQASFAFAPWSQAWSPLFLQWQINWWPTVEVLPLDKKTPPAAAVYPTGPHAHGLRDNWAFAQSGWQFDGSDNVSARGSEYYSWAGGGIWVPPGAPPPPSPPTQVTPRTYGGRTFLTPHAIDAFVDRLSKYVKLHPDDTELETIETLIEAIGETHILSQTLSGFNDAFRMRSLTQTSPPPAGSAIAAAIGAENRGLPDVGAGDQDLRFDGGTPFFFPVRGGYFEFNRLVIVDAFGQVLDLLYANGNAGGDAVNFQPIPGAGLRPEANSGVPNPTGQLRQAPRIVQPSRLDLRLLDAADDSKEIYYDGGANPVCGWLLPNHLDRSIAVYDSSGLALGELIVLAQESSPDNPDAPPLYEVKWLPAPDVANPITDPSQIANLHLRAAMSAFIGPGGITVDRVAAFKALYQSIDETLWTVDPPGGQADHDVAVLIGRPLAMVRAQVQFELFGRPATNQSWRDTLQDQTAQLTDQALDSGVVAPAFSFPIRLGSTELLDDGLIGYFTCDDYTKFSAVHASATATSPYVVPIVPGNYLSLPFNYPTYKTVELTMLLDPRGKAHAAIGLLPTASLTLPPEYYVEALRRMAVTFRVGPALTQPDAVRIPLPAEHEGTWSWIRHTGTDAASWEIDPIVAADASARLADKPPRLIDGWLKFTPTKSL